MAEEMVYIGKESCGCVTVVISDAPDCTKMAAREVARMHREGMTVERVPWGEMQKMGLGCPHKKMGKGRWRMH